MEVTFSKEVIAYNRNMAEKYWEEVCMLRRFGRYVLKLTDAVIEERCAELLRNYERQTEATDWLQEEADRIAGEHLKKHCQAVDFELSQKEWLNKPLEHNSSTFGEQLNLF